MHSTYADLSGWAMLASSCVVVLVFVPRPPPGASSPASKPKAPSEKRHGGTSAGDNGNVEKSK